jgi:serine/threonine-protein kinase HipA
MRLASLAKLDVPNTKLERIGGRSVMLIKRFDRYLIDGIQHRHHMISALTMLGCHESESRTKSYWDIAASIRARTPVSIIKKSQKELLGRMVFIILVTNDDDHLRNHAFLWDSKNRGWALSKLYDLMPHPTVSFERNLHLSIGMQGRAATLDNALSGYANFGITFEDACQIIDRIWPVVREWKVHFESFGVPESEINKI